MKELKFKVITDDGRMIGPFDLSQNPATWEGLEDGKRLLFTGLLDTHNNEVYVGDIIRCSRGCDHRVIINMEYGGRFIGGMPAIYLSGVHEGYAWTGDELIVGNIHTSEVNE